MKKNYFLGLIALTALSVTSCTNDEVVEAMPQQQAIEFGTYLGRDAQARNAQLTTDNFENFGVLAYYTGQNEWNSLGTNNAWPHGYGVDVATPNFMYNQLVEVTQPVAPATERTYSYSPLKYWPTTKNDKITFFAYAPFEDFTNSPTYNITAMSVKTAKGLPTITYKIDGDNLDKQVDFVADALIDEKRNAATDPDATSREVEFKLNHELTRVSFTAQLDKDINDGSNNKSTVNIKSIKFGGSKNFLQGTYTFADENDNLTVNPQKINRGSWSFTGVTATYLEIVDNKLMSTDDTSLNGYVVSGVRLIDNTQIILFGENNYLFLLPANGVEGLGVQGDITLTITYDIVTEDTNLNLGYSVTETTKVIQLPVGTLAQGKAYNYDLTFYLNQIVFKATVSTWDTTSLGQNQNVDWNDTDTNLSL